MASQPLDIVRAQIGTSARDNEYIDLGETDPWPDADKRRAAHELIHAGEQGDPRIPLALWGLLPQTEVLAALEDLLANAPLPVRVEAAAELLKKGPRSFAANFSDALRASQFGGYAQTRVIDLLIQAGDQKALVDIVRTTTHDDVRSAIIDRLWDQSPLGTYPTAMWKGLGLVKWQVSLPFASFRQPLMPTVTALLGGTPPDQLGFAPMTDEMPPELVAAFTDVDGGKGPIPDGILAALDEEKRKALLVYAADRAAGQQTPRALSYVAKLGKGAHDDVLKWAASQPSPAFAQAARDALAAKP